MRQDAFPLIRANHLSKKVPSGDSDLTILKDVNLTIQSSESVAILGASGSGKTTLLTLLGGLDLPSTGDLYFQDQLLTTLDEEKRALIRGKNIGFIFQSFQLLPTLTALENVMLPLEIRYMEDALAKSIAIDWLKQVGLEKRMQHYPSQLSGGEQQRVAIARAFVTQPQLILADEITGNLDTQTGKSIMEMMFAINQSQQTTLVLVTHDDRLAQRCQTRYLLTEGVLQSC